MKKYLLFAWSAYEAMGGASDFIDSFDTIEEAKTAFVETGQEDGHIAIIDGDKLKTPFVYGQWGRDQFSSWKEFTNG